MRRKQRWGALILVLALVVTFLSVDGRPSPVYAKNSSDIKKEKEEQEEKLEELENLKDQLMGELGDMKSDLSEVSDKVYKKEVEIEKIEGEIEIKKAEIEEAEKKLEQQYADMKVRIQFMYENGNDNQLNFVFGAGSISEFLNRAEYISSLTKYDRSLMTSYEETKAGLESDKATLENKLDKLVAKKEELESEKDELLAQIKNQKSDISDANQNIDDQEAIVGELADQLKKMIEYEKKLEEQLGHNKPDVSSMVAESLIQREKSMPTWGKIVTPKDGEEELLAAIIYCEAGDEPYEGMVAVGTVVLNRVNSQYFKNSITDVIYSPGQFTPVWSGRLQVVIDKGLTSSDCKKAAREVLEGNFTGTWLYFCSVRPSAKGDLIGTQVFY